MARYERILLATDLSEQANKALAEAVSLARRDHAELHVLHVDVVHQPDIEGFDHAALAAHVHNLGETALSAVGRDVGVSYKDAVTAVIRDTTAAGGILRYAADKQVDLIVVGTHGRGTVAEWVLGSVAQQVVREAPIPVMIVGAHRSAKPLPRGGKPVILAPVDLSPRCAAALAQAGALAAARHAHLVALHAIDFARLPRATPPSRVEDETRERLEAFVERAALPVEAECLLGLGAAADVIFEVAAKRGARLIVLAPSSHGVIGRMLLGSVTQRVVRGAPCPVLVHRGPAAARPHAAPEVSARA